LFRSQASEKGSMEVNLNALPRLLSKPEIFRYSDAPAPHGIRRY